MQFVRVDQEGHFSVSEEAARVLRGLEAPPRVVSIVGKYRTGKSSILNAVVGDRVFDTASTVQAHTKGLSLYFDASSGTILLDTEGLGSMQASKNHDAAIFALAMVVSSGCFFNNVGAITSENLDQLHLATKIAGLLSAHGKLSLELPPLVWVLRDFSLELKDVDGVPIDASTYLAQCMAANASQETMASLSDLFPQKEAIVLPRPADDDEDVQAMRNLKQGFLDSVGRVRDRALRFGPRRRRGAELTGADLCDLVVSMCDALNAGGVVPDIDSFWDSVLAKMRAQAGAAALAAFQSGDDLREKTTAALRAYEEALPGETVCLGECVDLLDSIIGGPACDDLRALREQLRSTGVEYRARLDALQAERDVLAEAAAGHRETVEDLRREIVSLGRDLLCKDDERTVEAQELEDCRAHIVGLEASLARGLGTLKHRYAEVLGEKGQISSELESTSAKLDSSEAARKDLARRAKVLEAQLRQAQDRCKQSDDVVADYRRLNDQLRTDAEGWKVRYEEGRATKRQKHEDGVNLELLKCQAELQYFRQTKDDQSNRLAAVQKENASLRQQNQVLSIYASFDAPGPDAAAAGNRRLPG